MGWVLLKNDYKPEDVVMYRIYKLLGISWETQVVDYGWIIHLINRCYKYLLVQQVDMDHLKELSNIKQKTDSLLFRSEYILQMYMKNEVVGYGYRK